MEEVIQVSVVIPSYQRTDRLHRLLKSLYEQECKFSYEIIIVDDGSPTPIAPAISEVLQESPVSINCVTKENGGPASARNYGAKIAKGEYIIFVDDDMIISSNFIQAHIDSQIEAGGGFINCLYDWQIESPSKSFNTWYSKQTQNWTEALHRDLESKSTDVFSATHASSLTGCNLSVKREDYLQLGGIDEGYENYGCEDQDLGLRAEKIGVKVYHSSKTRSIHLEWHNSFERFCHRQMIGTIDTVRFVRRFAVIENGWQAPHVKTFGYIQLGKDSFSLILKKLIRSLLTLPIILQANLTVIKILEFIAPNSHILFKFYDALVGAYIQKGWRTGLMKYDKLQPLPAWTPKLEV